MAKAFYSMEEVCELLGKSQDEVKQLVQTGSLREFRDAGKIFFKAEDVNKLTGGDAAASEDSGEVMLEPASEPEAPAEEELPTVADAEGTSVIGLEVVQEPESPRGGGGEKDTVITSSGIGVFDDDELEIDADPMAETQITAGPGEDHVSLEGSGSGSGLLDLTREADDTSMGELLDEIYPGEEEAVEAEAPPLPPATEEPEVEAEEEPEPEPERVSVVEVAAPTYTAVGDLSEGLFAGLMVGTLILLVVAGSVVAGILQGFFPDYAGFLSDNFWFFLGGAVLLPILALLVGWVIGKAAAPKRA